MGLKQMNSMLELPKYLLKKYTRRQKLLKGFREDFEKFHRLFSKSQRDFEMSWGNIYPQLYDKLSHTPFDRHYVFHPAWAARKIASFRPGKHVDLSSTLHFGTLLSAFIPVEFYDYRPIRSNLSDLKSDFADLTKLPFESSSIHSLSCMHVVEHIGLGRYGDPLDADGDLKAIEELKRVLAPGGRLYFVVPIGAKSQIQYNAHRIYTQAQILSYFPSKEFELEDFTLIPDDEKDGDLVVSPSPELLSKQNYACGCFLFKRKL